MIGKLRAKFVAINMGLVTLVLVITFLAVYASTQQRLARESMSSLERALSGQAHTEPHDDKFRPGSDPGHMPNAQFNVTLDDSGQIARVHGVLFDLSDEAALQAIVDLCLQEEADSGVMDDANLRYLRQETPEGTRIAFVDRNMEINTLRSLVTISLLVGSGSLLAFLLISLFLSRWVLQPVEEAWERQRQFVSDASHELKTPLTVILANAGIVLSHPEQTVGEQAKWIEYIRTEAARMTTLVSNLLFLAQSDEANPRGVMKGINLGDAVWSAVLPFESLVFEQGKTLDCDIASDVHINGDESQIRQLTTILLDNACKYANDKGRITVRLEASGERSVRLAISNTGGYIPREQLDSVFERFVRLDKSRTRKEGGYGLGLAIARSIAEIHNARISVQSTSEEGTTFMVSFPGQGGVSR